MGTDANPNGQPNYALYYALDDTFAVFSQNPANNDPNSSFYTAPINNTVTDTQGGYTVTAVAPTGYNQKQVQVTVSFNAVATFVQVLGPFKLGWLPSTTSGLMVGDYMSNSFAGGKSYPVFAAALQSPCQLGSNNCKETMIRPLQGLAPGASTHPARQQVRYQGQASAPGGTLLAHR